MDAMPSLAPMTPLTIFLSGAVTIGFAVAGLFFLRFWHKTRDKLFRAFATAFWMMAIERVILVSMNVQDETRTYVYLIRLVAFLLIIKAIYEKNRPIKDKRISA